MFKKTKIAAVTAAVLGLSSMAAQAVSLNEAASQGQVLIFPYYNVNNGFVTVFKVTNTTNETKAVKIRFRESENSNDVLDFNLYMSPFDVFRMDLVEGPDGGVLLKAPDTSCTHPEIPDAGIDFRHDVYEHTDVSDVREGYLEVIEMGVVPIGKLEGQEGSAINVVAGVDHGTTGVPADCSVISDAWQQGVFTQGGAASNTATIDIRNPNAIGFKYEDPNMSGSMSESGFYGKATVANLSKPTGGLIGTSIFIDTLNTAGYVAEPTSIVNYSTIPQHYLSSDQNFYLLPSLASGSIQSTESFTYDAAGAPMLVTRDYPTVTRDWGLDDPNVTPRTPVASGINPFPIADAMAVTVLGNQYFLGEGGTVSDFVVSAPMRKHGIYNNYQFYPAGTTEPTTGEFVPVAGEVENGFWKKLSGVDLTSTFTYFNNEEQFTQPQPGDFSPPKETETVTQTFDREVNILALHIQTLGEAASVLGSVNAEPLPVVYTEGWGVFSFTKDEYNLGADRFAAWGGEDSTIPDAMGAPLFGFAAIRTPLNDGHIGETFPNIYNRKR
ncbi:MAG: hypothetical protein GQ583_07620 [Methyloprofundus sp.]|nr:hypothetical protein [Methyloprofundus sp.]